MVQNKEYKNSIELNLCKILKGHEEEIFYSPLFGQVHLYEILTNTDFPIKVYTDKPENYWYFTAEGKYHKQYVDAECVLFPSKDQRDWLKWDKENNPKTPKTWSELEVESNDFYRLEHFGTNTYSTIDGKTPIEKSALALLKIYQLIEIGYGGNVTDQEWRDDKRRKWYFVPNDSYSPNDGNEMWDITFSEIYYAKRPFAFHTKKQVEEFLSYTENVQLLKDYFML